MQLTELLFQKVRELGPQGSLALRPGYCALVGRSRQVRRALTAALFPGPADAKHLSDGQSNPRVGVGLVAGDGQPYRLLRELGGGRQLQRFDPASRKFAPLTEDDLEIASFLRGEGQLPAPESYEQFFVLEASELPSQRGGLNTPAAGVSAVDQEKVRKLKAELQQTKEFEEAQDKLFKVQTRLQELGEVAGKLDVATQELQALEAQVTRALFTPAQQRELTGRAQRAAGDQKKYIESLADNAKQQQRVEEEALPEPDPFLKDPMFGGGLVGAVAVFVLTFVFKEPHLAFLAMVPGLASLISVLKWIDLHEACEQQKAAQRRLKEREEALKRGFTEEQAPLKAALKTAGVESPEALVELFRGREQVEKLRDDAKARLDKLREDPRLAEVEAERPKLLEEKQILEVTVAAQGFARSLGEIEKDLRRELGLVQDPAAKKASTPGAAEAEAIRFFGDKAAELVGVTPPELWAQIAARLATYCVALTDKKIVGGRSDGALLLVTAADGRSGPFHTLPQPLRDQVYAAARLTLLERVAAEKKLPVFVDDTFAPLEPQKRVLVAKMLKGIAGQTQVLHRTAEPPPAGLADHVVNVVAGP
jgi:hypothetical protein